MARLERILTRGVLTVPHAACVVALATLLNACDHISTAKQDRVVSVNGEEITRGDLQVAAEALGADSTTVVESLIDEKLLAQQAISVHLDRDATVLLQIEHARRQILARAYEERTVLPRLEIGMAAKHEYYANNPALFAQRRIYRTLTFSIPPVLLTQTLRNELDRVRSALHVRELLNRRQIPFEAVEVTRPAEEIPAEVLPKLAQATAGDVLIASPPQAHVLLICVVSAHDSPVDFEHAHASIRQHLADARNREAVVQYLRQARSAAKISYVDASHAPPTSSTDQLTIQKGTPFE